MNVGAKFQDSLTKTQPSIQLLRYFSLWGIGGPIKRPTVPSVVWSIKRKHATKTQWMQQGTDCYRALGPKQIKASVRPEQSHQTKSMRRCKSTESSERHGCSSEFKDTRSQAVCKNTYFKMSPINVIIDERVAHTRGHLASGAESPPDCISPTLICSAPLVAFRVPT